MAGGVEFSQTRFWNVYVHGESLRGSRALLLPELVILVVGERNLLPVIRGEKSDLREAVRNRSTKEMGNYLPWRACL